MTFIMRYGFRIVPTDRALAGCPPGLPPAPGPPAEGSFLPVLAWLWLASLPADLPEAGGRKLPAEVSVQEAHALIRGVGDDLFPGC